VYQNKLLPPKWNNFNSPICWTWNCVNILIVDCWCFYYIQCEAWTV